RARSLPGVEAAAVGGDPLTVGFDFSTPTFQVDGHTVDRPPSDALLVKCVDADYFKTLRQPLRTGRTFDADDTPSTPGVAVVDESTAKRLWPGETAVGHTLQAQQTLGNDRVIGVVGDVKYSDLVGKDQLALYVSRAQKNCGGSSVIVRGNEEI